MIGALPKNSEFKTRVRNNEDGRISRRLENRSKVVRALLDFFQEGILDPSIEDIADRADISARSIFRYFDDLGDLTKLAIEMAHSEIYDHFKITLSKNQPLEERVSKLVLNRVALFDAIWYPAIVVRRRESINLVLATELSKNRKYLRKEIVDGFSDILSCLDTSEREATIDGIDILLSFESFYFLRSGRKRSKEQSGTALIHGVMAILCSPSTKPQFQK